MPWTQDFWNTRIFTMTGDIKLYRVYTSEIIVPLFILLVHSPVFLGDSISGKYYEIIHIVMTQPL